MTALFDGIQELFGEVFGAEYLDGTLYRATRTEKKGGGVTVAFAEIPIKGQIDQISEVARVQAGYTAKQQRLIVLQLGPDGLPIGQITSDDQIELVAKAGTIRWTIAGTDQDPAASHWIIRGERA